MTYMLQTMFLSLCFNYVTCKEKMCGTVKQDFTLEEASQIWLSEQVTLKCEAWQNQPSSSWHFVREVIKPNISKHFPKCLTVTLNFNFMQWNLFTRCGTDSAWWLVMWQQFRETIICKLSLIIKDRTETSIPGLKPVLLWFSKGRQDQEFKVFLSAGT